MIRIPQEINQVLEKLHNHGYEAFVVGGCVRDSLLNKEPSDWDVTTSATPEEIKRCFEKTIDTGIKHGTVTVLIFNEKNNQNIPVEVTTYRIDGEYTDGRHPDSITFTGNIKEDLARRDFTINAMAYNRYVGLVDLFGGEKDLAFKVIRCVGSPEKRFGEDALRIMRGIRFASQLKFKIEENTEKAMFEMADTLSKVAIERINVEFNKTIMGDYSDEIFDKYRNVLEKGINQPLNFGHTNFAKLPKNLAIRIASLGKINLKKLKYDNNLQRKTERILAAIEYLESKKSYDGCGISKIEIKKMLKAFSPDGVIGAFEIKEINKDILNEILNNKECFTLKELDVKGRDLNMEPGPQMGEALNFLLDAVVEEKVVNEKENLLEYLTKKWKLLES